VTEFVGGPLEREGGLEFLRTRRFGSDLGKLLHCSALDLHGEVVLGPFMVNDGELHIATNKLGLRDFGGHGVAEVDLSGLDLSGVAVIVEGLADELLHAPGDRNLLELVGLDTVVRGFALLSANMVDTKKGFSESPIFVRNQPLFDAAPKTRTFEGGAGGKECSPSSMHRGTCGRDPSSQRPILS